MQNKKIGFEIGLEGIGAFESKTNYSQKNFSSNQTLIFAENGSGKTFISKCFELFDKNFSDKITIGNKLLNLNKFGNFKFKISSIYDGKESTVEEIDIKIYKDKILNIKETNYIYHVFNEDYIKQQKFEINKKDGYIMVGEEVDLTNEIKELEQVKNELRNNIISITSKIDDILYEDKNNNVEKEYIQILTGRLNSSEGKSYRAKLDLIRKLKTENEIKPIKIPTSSIENISDDNFFRKCEEIKKYKEHNYDEIKDIDNLDILMLGEINFTDLNFNLLIEKLEKIPEQCIINDKKLIEFINNNINFISDGIILKGEDNICPFCKRELVDEALNIVINYNKFLQSEEKKYKDALSNEKLKFENTLKNITNSIENKFEIIQLEFGSLKSKLPNFQENIIQLDRLKLNELKTINENIIQTISEKITDTQNSNKVNYKDVLNTIKQSYNTIIECIKNNIYSINQNIKDINSKKNGIKNQKTNDIKEFLELLENKILQIKEIETYNHNIDKKNEIENKIKDLENKNKIPKDDIYKKTLKEIMNGIFNGKYSLDENNTNKIKFQNKNDITTNIDNILSEGEKTILSFCYYIAETHLKIEKEEDYKKLFFIIDDPISSLDENYIYSVSEIIRNINEIFENKLKYTKYIILTHSFNFLSILYRNNICKNFIKIYKNEKIREFKELDTKIMRFPYFSHLLDIYQITQDIEKISHTTANSLRQVIETIRDFESPNLSEHGDCSTFLNDENRPQLKDCVGLYTASNNGSHAYFGNLTNTELFKMCQSIIDYIRQKYKDVIDFIEKEYLDYSNMHSSLNTPRITNFDKKQEII